MLMICVMSSLVKFSTFFMGKLKKAVYTHFRSSRDNTSFSKRKSNIDNIICYVSSTKELSASIKKYINLKNIYFISTWGL